MDRYIRQIYGRQIPQSIIEKALRNKDILLNGAKTKSSARVSSSDEVFVHPAIQRLFARIALQGKDVPSPDYSRYAEQFKGMIIYEDADWLIINKPAGLAVQLGSKMKSALDVMAKAYNPQARLVHRIDKETSGITVFAKNVEIARYMLHLFKSKQVCKKYYAIVSGRLDMLEGKISKPLTRSKSEVVVDFQNGKNAITEFRVLKHLKGVRSLVEARPLTGRTHQIRVHMASIGYPIVGDGKYGNREGKKNDHLLLHAYEVSFKTPQGKTLTKRAPLPEYFR